MAQLEVVVKRLLCLRCRHGWIPNSTNVPKVCPSCHSPYWNSPRSLNSGMRGRRTNFRRHAIATGRKAPKSLFGSLPNLPKFVREEEDFRV